MSHEYRRRLAAKHLPGFPLRLASEIQGKANGTGQRRRRPPKDCAPASCGPTPMTVGHRCGRPFPVEFVQCRRRSGRPLKSSVNGGRYRRVARRRLRHDRCPRTNFALGGHSWRFGPKRAATWLANLDSKNYATSEDAVFPFLGEPTGTHRQSDYERTTDKESHGLSSLFLTSRLSPSSSPCTLSVGGAGNSRLAQAPTATVGMQVNAPYHQRRGATRRAWWPRLG